MEFPKNNIINNWLHENGQPEVEKLVAKNLAIANKIAELLQHKGLKAADLARLLNKKPSEISKWLTGTHTFTTKTITKIEQVLGEEIIYVEPQKEYIYFKVLVKDQEDAVEMAFEPTHVNTKDLDQKKVS
ncbi:MAG: helix-turn-helix domain-containing protein [Flavobacterium sp.]|jgi:transcriptional regulator with XRE-family HTH domain|uniref:helix-turn-helix domain-containing protein n=1 Tax=Flavobacterium sp. TaxID=239 RepID=UPI003BA737EE